MASLSLGGLIAWGPPAPVRGQDAIATIDGRAINGEIAGIADGQVRLADKTEFPLAQLLSVDRRRSVSSQAPLPIHVHLAFGGVLHAQSVSLESEKFGVQSSFGQIALPIEAIRAVVFKPSRVITAITESLSRPSTQLDILWAEADDQIQSAAGLVHTIAGGKISGEFAGQQRSVASSRVVAYVAADLGLQSPKGLATLGLTDGSHIRGQIEQLNNGQFSIRVSSSGSIVVPWNMVAQIGLESDRLVWLSNLSPVEQVHEPLVTHPREHQVDRSVGGNPLTLRTSLQREPLRFARGLGVHAYSRLVYHNDDGFDRLVATVGIDAETKGLGDCIFMIRGDGIELWSRRIRAADDPVDVDVDISNVREVSLIVEPGPQLDLADHANWCDARWVKTD